MKKIRMIVTSVIVLAIVGSAFSFRTKIGLFCVLDAAASGTNCTTYLQDRKTTVIGGTQYKYFPCWDFNTVTCTAANNGLCTGGPIRLIID